MKNQTKKKQNILPLKEKIGYGFGDLASVLYWQTFMLYFTYFYTDVFLLPASIAASMFLISRVFDAVNDPMMGIIADRTNTKWGKFRPYLLWLCVPFAISGILVFTTPNFGMTGKIIWAYSTFILIMVLYTAINIPYTSLLGVISPNSSERTSVSSVKFLFAFSAGIIISATLLPTVKILGAGDESIVSTKLKDNILEVNEVEKGNAKLIITATDVSGNSTKQEIGFKVNPVENNTPVVSKPIGDISFKSGFKSHKIAIDEVFTGKLDNGFEYNVKSSNPEIADVSINGKSLIINEKNSGNTKITLSAKDKKWGEQIYDFYLSIIDKGNNPPILKDSTSLFKLSDGFKSATLNLNDLISDPDGDKLTYTITSNNSKVINPTVRDNILSFIKGKIGLAKLDIIARDGRGGQYIHSIKYIVAMDKNNPPFINNQVDNIVKNVGFGLEQISISDLFIDVEGDELNYSIKVINDAKGWQRTFMIVGVAAILFFLIAFRSTKERVLPPKSQKTSIGRDLKDLVTNKPWLILLATTITFILFVAVRGSVTIHYFKYFIGTQDIKLPFLGLRSYDFEALASAYNTIGQISSFLGVLFVAWFAKIIGKKKAFVIMFIIAIFSTGILYFLNENQLGQIFFYQITGSMTGGPLSVLLWAMYADTADFGEWKQGRRATGLIFSASTMSQKFGWAFGAFLALTLMANLGFKPNEVQSPDSLNGLLLLFSLIPAAMGILSIGLSLIYPLNEKRVKEIQDELISRRESSSDN